jgi:hypothetical protein
MAEIMGVDIEKMADETNPKETQLIEALAELEHTQWVAWSKDIAEKEKLSRERLRRWKGLWIPYSELSEEMKEEDRKWARKAIKIIKGEGMNV